MDVGWNTSDWQPFIRTGLLELPASADMLDDHGRCGVRCFIHIAGFKMFQYGWLEKVKDRKEPGRNLQCGSRHHFSYKRISVRFPKQQHATVACLVITAGMSLQEVPRSMEIISKRRLW